MMKRTIPSLAIQSAGQLGNQNHKPYGASRQMQGPATLNPNPSNGTVGNNRRRWTAISENHDPRVTYSAEPWNNPLKQTTGLSGLIVDHRWRKKLIALYTCILTEVKMIPEDNPFRMAIENIYREFLRVVTNVGDTDWAVVERKIGLGQVEQLIEFAMDERELVQMYSEWKLWLIPVETVRELVEESKASSYYQKVGPPEPYLSDEEIGDMKKIDQQRMAEEQKSVAQDLKRLSGRSSRLLIEDENTRVSKRLAYKAAVEEYIRETKLGHAFKIASDGSVEGDYTAGSVQKPHIPEDSSDPRVNIETKNKYEDPAHKAAAVSDWKESMYWSKALAPPDANTDSSGIPETNEGILPARLTVWEASKESGVSSTLSAVDSPHSAPAAKASKQGRKISKWIRPESNLQSTQEQPAHKK